MNQKLFYRKRIDAIVKQLRTVVKSKNLNISSINGKNGCYYHIYSPDGFICMVKLDGKCANTNEHFESALNPIAIMHNMPIKSIRLILVNNFAI